MSIQDLIQEARRLARRQGTTGISLVHLGSSAYIMANPARYHYFRNGIAELAAARGMKQTLLDNQTLCLVGADEPTHGALLRLLDGESGHTGAALSTIVERFELPAQYRDLRERLAGLEQEAEGGDAGGERPPDRAAPAAGSEPLAGPLTPRRLAVIERRLDGVDLELFVQRRPVYAATDGWRVVYIDHVTNLDALAAAFFPAVEFTRGEPLFLELRRHLDRLMLVALLLNRPWRRQAIGVTLAHAAWATDEFRRLRRRLDDAERRRLTIELDWLDALRDAATGGKVVAELREAGFRIAVGGIGIDALPLANLERLDADWLKLAFDRHRLAALASPPYLDAMRRLDPDRLILTDADDKRALEVGAGLGIRHFQGPLIDRLARGATASEQKMVNA